MWYLHTIFISLTPIFVDKEIPLPQKKCWKRWRRETCTGKRRKSDYSQVSNIVWRKPEDVQLFITLSKLPSHYFCRSALQISVQDTLRVHGSHITQWFSSLPKSCLLILNVTVPSTWCFWYCMEMMSFIRLPSVLSIFTIKECRTLYFNFCHSCRFNGTYLRD